MGPLRRGVECNYAEAARCLHVPQMEEVKKAAQEEFDHISARAHDEVKRPERQLSTVPFPVLLSSPQRYLYQPPPLSPPPSPFRFRSCRLSAWR